jgi:uncharacterized protein YprB with RNaseH-like and TPR domain/predicted RNA-binding Zn-ribbon protein involved in translation (DUF1610 family)
VWGIHKQHIGAHQIVEPVRMLSFAAKWYDEKQVFYTDERNGREQMLADLWALLDVADAVIHYNGTSFDMPHINREFLLGGLGPPTPYAQIDLWRTVRSQFRFMSNKLDSVAGELGIGHKAAHEGFGLWVKCLAGDEKAWRRMKRYNIQDVRLTEKLYTELRPWIKGHPSSNLVSGVDFSCPTCGSGALTKRGVARTKISTFQRYQCLQCGSYSQGNKRLAGVTVRSC